MCDDGPRQLQVRGLPRTGEESPVLLFNRLGPSDGWVRYSTEGERPLLLLRSTTHNKWVLGRLEFKPTTMTDDDLRGPNIATIGGADLPIGNRPWQCNKAATS